MKKYLLKCPHCGQYKRFRTTTTANIVINDNCIDQIEVNQKLNIYETMVCIGCGFVGITSLFMQEDTNDGTIDNPARINFMGTMSNNKD